MAEGENSTVSLFSQRHQPYHNRDPFIHYLLKTPSPSTVIYRVRASAYEFRGKHNDHKGEDTTEVEEIKFGKLGSRRTSPIQFSSQRTAQLFGGASVDPLFLP